jgi:hypothetical protein
MSSAFQWTAFQVSAFQCGAVATDTDDLQLPVNCVLAEYQLWSGRLNVVEWRGDRRSEKVAASRSRRERLSNATSSFTVRTDSRGYD